MAESTSINFGGLVSGLDTQQLIEQLMTVESKPLTRFESQKTDLSKKVDTYTSMKSSLLELMNKVSDLRSSSAFGIFSVSSSDEEALNISASASANEGTYSVKILSLAQAKALSSNSYESMTTPLKLTGEILINNKSIEVRDTDSLMDIRNTVNTLNNGVTASIITVSDRDNRLIISSKTQGTDGFSLGNVGSTNILNSLGFTDGTKTIRENVNGRVLSSTFDSAESTLGSLLGISSQVNGTVKINDASFSVDVSADSLSTVRDKINGLGLPGVSAEIISVNEGNIVSYQLSITGETSFADESNIFEILGIYQEGTSGINDEFRASKIFTTDNNDMSLGEETLIALGAKTSETITLSGTTVNGSSITKTITIDKDSTLQTVLDAIEEAFAGDVSASIENGHIVIQSTVAGKTTLSINIHANNERGGTLDFGSIAKVTEGRKRLISEGINARILINNIEIERSSNEINDAVNGIKMTLKKADQYNNISVTVKRDNDAIRTKIEDFVTNFNAVADFIEKNSQYDKESKVAGPLLGDMTALTALSRLRSALQMINNSKNSTYHQLAEIGIETTTDGKLKIVTDTLNEALSENVDSVITLFSASRASTNSDIQFVYHSEKSKAGTYAVSVTRAAEKAAAVSEPIEDNINQSGTMTITDTTGNTMNIAYTDAMILSDLVNVLNEESQRTYNEIQKSSHSLTTSNNTAAISLTTTLQDIDGVSIEDNDTVTIRGTTRLGKNFNRIISVDKTTSIQTILDTIEQVNNNEVVASITPDGLIRVEDNSTGKSSISLTIETTVEGLNFGLFDSIQSGRDKVSVTASIDSDNHLVVSHKEYGSNNTISIAGASGLGITDGMYYGVDVAGTINGKDGTGRGQTLTASNSDEYIRGIAVKVDTSPEELKYAGQVTGNITLITGVAEKIYSELSSLTNAVNGFVQTKIDSLNKSVVSLATKIAATNKQLEYKRSQYKKKFTELELTMAKLNSTMNKLSSLSS